MKTESCSHGVPLSCPCSFCATLDNEWNAAIEAAAVSVGGMLGHSHPAALGILALKREVKP